jgi:hypothetical protein
MQSLTRFKDIEVDFFNYHAVDIVETVLNNQAAKSLNDKISVLEEKLQAICNSYMPKMKQ